MSVNRYNHTKHKFDLLYASLCEIQKSLLDSTAKVAGFLLLATGWIATSTAARDFLKADELSRYIAVAALGGAFLFYALAAGKAHQASARTFELLIELDWHPQEYYVLRKVDWTTLILFVVGNLFLALLVGSLILSTGVGPQEVTRDDEDRFSVNLSFVPTRESTTDLLRGRLICDIRRCKE